MLPFFFYDCAHKCQNGLMKGLFSHLLKASWILHSKFRIVLLLQYKKEKQIQIIIPTRSYSLYLEIVHQNLHHPHILQGPLLVSPPRFLLHQASFALRLSVHKITKTFFRVPSYSTLLVACMISMTVPLCVRASLCWHSSPLQGNFQHSLVLVRNNLWRHKAGNECGCLLELGSQKLTTSLASCVSKNAQCFFTCAKRACLDTVWCATVSNSTQPLDLPALSQPAVIWSHWARHANKVTPRCGPWFPASAEDSPAGLT